MINLNNKNVGCLLHLNSYFILPSIVMFTLVWFLLGGLGGSNITYWIVLIMCIAYILISVGLVIKYASNASTSRQKKIFIVGITILIIAMALFLKFYHAS